MPVDHDLGSARRLTTPYEGLVARGWDPDAPIPGPLSLHRARVPADWVDYNDHMTESAYLHVVGDGADAFFRFFGIDEAYRAAGHSLFTAETHLHHLAEAAVDDELRVDLRLLDVDAKRLHVFHEVHNESTERLAATAEQLLLHVDTRAGRVTPLPDHLLTRLRSIRAAHARLPVPAAVGHVMQIPHATDGA